MQLDFWLCAQKIVWPLVHANEGLKHMLHSALKVLGAPSGKRGDWG